MRRPFFGLAVYCSSYSLEDFVLILGINAIIVTKLCIYAIVYKNTLKITSFMVYMIILICWACGLYVLMNIYS